MKDYKVTARVTYTRTYAVRARNEDEARRIVTNDAACEPELENFSTDDAQVEIVGVERA